MRRFLLIAGLLACAVSARANGTCAYPSTTSGCPPSWAFAKQGVTTPTAIANTAYTGANGVSTAGLYVQHGLVYNNACGYSAPVSNVQSSCDITVVAPMECYSSLGGSPGSCYVVFCIHGGAFAVNGNDYEGCWGDSTIAQEDIFYVQKYLGVPNPVGNKIAIVTVDYRLIAQSGGLGTNSYPIQWQDGKCALWYTIANSSIMPFSTSIMGIYGPSAGGTLAMWAALTPDNYYNNPGCNASPPATDPQYRIAAAWPFVSWIYPYNNTVSNNSTGAQNVVRSEMDANAIASIKTNCGSTTPTCDPAENILLGGSSTNTALKNAQVLYQFGSCDMTVIPYWNSNTGGNLYNLAAAYAGGGSGLNPFMELFPSSVGCTHEATIGHIDGAAQIDAFNFLLAVANSGSGGLGGSFGQ